MAAGRIRVAGLGGQTAAPRAAAAGAPAERCQLFRRALGMALPCRALMAPAATQNEPGRAMTVPDYWKQATRELSERDPVIRKIARKSHGLTLRSRGDAFSTLARSIVGQQISVKA